MSATAARLRSLGRRVGGPNAVTRTTFWVLLAISLVAHVAESLASGVPLRILPVRVAFVVVAVAAAYGAMLVLRRLLLRDAATIAHPWRALLVFALAAVVRGAVLSALIALLLGEPAQVAFRIAAAVTLVVPVLAITAAVVDVLREHAARRDELLGRNAELVAARDDAVERAETERDGAVERIQLLLADRLAGLEGGNPDAAAALLRADVADVIRPLSHRIAPIAARVGAAPAAATIRWREIWRDASLGDPIRPTVIAVLGLVASIPSILSRSPGTGLVPKPLDALAGALCVAVCGWVAMSLVRRLVNPLLPRLQPGARTALLVAAAAMGLAATAAASGVAVRLLTGAPNVAIALAIVVVGTLVVLLVALLQGIEHLLNAVDAELASTNAALEYEVARVNAVAWHQRNQLAIALHGPVQTAVTAAAMQLEQAMGGADADAAVASARQLIADAIGRLDGGSEHVDGIEVQLAELARTWDGLCAVTWSVDDATLAAIDADAAVASAVGDICTEACSNAVRHGGATRVEIVAAALDDRLRLEVGNDGADPGERRGGGLGTAILDAVALDWRRTRIGERTVLEVDLALAPAVMAV